MMKYSINCKYFSEHYSKIIFEDNNIIVIQQGLKITVFKKSDINKNYLK